ncbi:MAG: four helix bundle protein [Bdellovibrionota bacterium]
MIRNFLAYELAIELHRKTQEIELKHYMKDQLLRASQSVVLNLAEGSAKPTKRDKARFYAIAFGSIREIQAIFDLIQIKDDEILDLADHIAACVYKLSYPRKP